MQPTRRSLAVVLVLLGLAALGICVLGEGPAPTSLDEPHGSAPDGPRSDALADRAGGLHGRPSDNAAPGGPASTTPTDGAEVQPWPVGPAPEQNEGQGRVRVLLVNASGAALPDHPIEVSWWKAFGVMGDNSGKTDAMGRFRTSADEPWHLDSVSVPTHETVSPLYHAGPFAAEPDHPHEVRVVVPGGGLIRGLVLDSKGDPRPGLLIVAESERSLPRAPFDHPMHYNGASVHADALGRFSLPVVTGRHTVRLKAPGLQAVSEFRVHLTRTRPIADLVFRTWKPIHGRTLRVTLAGPVPEETRVTAYTVEGRVGSTADIEEHRLRARRAGLRLDDRTYEVRNLQGDGWEILVSVPQGDTRAVEHHLLPPGAVAIALPVPVAAAVPASPDTPARTIRLLAHRQDGTTSAPAVSVLRTYDLGQLAGPGKHKRKNGETHVKLADRDGEVYLIISEAGHGRIGVGPLRARTAPAQLDVQLPATGDARVAVVDPLGNPVDVELTLQPAWSFFRPLVEGRVGAPPGRAGFHSASLAGTRVGTGAPGHTTFRHLGSEPWQVTARPADERLPSARGELRVGASLRLVLGEGYTEAQVFTGRVVDALRGGPLAGIRIEAVTDDTAEGHAWSTAISAEDGSFGLRGLPARRTRFRVLGKGWAFPANTTLDLGAPPAPIVFALHAARRLPLRVVDGDGAPIRGALVRTAWPDGAPITAQDQYGGLGDESDDTDRGGRVDLWGLPAARIVLFVKRPGDPATAASRHEVDLSDPPPGLVTLRHER